MNRKVQFIFENKRANELISGEVELSEETTVDMKYVAAGKAKRFFGDFRWWINGLGIVMLDDNDGELADTGDWYIHITYFDENLNEGKQYTGFIDGLATDRHDDFTFKSIKMLYEFTQAIILEVDENHSIGNISVENISV